MILRDFTTMILRVWNIIKEGEIQIPILLWTRFFS